jgi:hypothetical protein
MTGFHCEASRNAKYLMTQDNAVFQLSAEKTPVRKEPGGKPAQDKPP